MLNAAFYRPVRRNSFWIHCESVRAHDRRAAYDYFMLLCGPLSAENQGRSRDGATSAVHLAGGHNLPAIEGQWRGDERGKRLAAVRPLGSSQRGYARQ